MHELMKAIRDGVDVINLSMAQPTEPSPRWADEAFKRAADHVFKDQASEDFEDDLKTFENTQETIMKVRMVRGYIQQAMNLAHKRGTTIVAASGYEIDPLQKTFAVYPEEKKIVS